jgi:hypothetical protein
MGFEGYWIANLTKQELYKFVSTTEGERCWCLEILSHLQTLRLQKLPRHPTSPQVHDGLI